jgi:serine/threonine protein kinase
MNGKWQQASLLLCPKLLDHSTGLLRRWDFTKAETRFQNEEARLEIAGREQRVVNWLKDRNPDLAGGVLQPRDSDPQRGFQYWEVFERRHRLKRLLDIPVDQLLQVARDNRIELVRQIVLRAKQLHDIGAAHLDIGLHSVWVEAPSITQLSHLMAASFPEVASLGQSRYQFLSSSSLPEDAFENPDTPQRKDVYLLGCVAHHLLLGCLPQAEDGMPACWDPAADPSGSIEKLHDWLQRSLELDPVDRFTDAGEMLEGLNRALSGYTTLLSVLESLERYHTVSSFKRLLKAYPEEQELRDDSRVSMWISEADGRPVVVKMWKRAGWTNQSTEAPRLLDFLEQATAIKADRPPGIAAIIEPIWLEEGLVLVTEYVAASNLASLLAMEVHPLKEPEPALMFLRALGEVVVGLHERMVAHGDLKPENILAVTEAVTINGEEVPCAAAALRPVLIDLLDFSPIGDGERMNTAYAPTSGGRFERDRFAVTVIAEELLSALLIAPLAEQRIAAAINLIRSATPANATLLPLLEALDHALSSHVSEPVPAIALVLPNDSGAPFDADEGNIAFSLARNGSMLYLRGEREQLLVTLNAAFHPVSAERRPIDVMQQVRQERFIFAAPAVTLEITVGAKTDLQFLAQFLTGPEIGPLWLAECAARQHLQLDLLIAEVGVTQDHSAELQEDDDLAEEEDVAFSDTEDQISEEAAQQTRIDENVDVPKLWERLLQLEADLIIKGVTVGPSHYNDKTETHQVEFSLESASFEFAREDTVNVSRLNAKGQWISIGRLDLARSTAAMLHIVRSRHSFPGEVLVEEGTSLRLESHFEATSRQRRREASDRILDGKGRIPNLIDYLHPRKGLRPDTLDHRVDPAEIIDDYELNHVQAAAFAKLISQRPLGLLQGPPGTGKTRFIAALVHYALRHNLAKNVLVASQSHEAVNGAAEAVLKLFKDDENIPSMLRVGYEGNVSEMLMPYHADQVQRLFKDRFRAELRQRLHVAGQALGLPTQLVDKLIVIETIVRPIVERLQELSLRPPSEDVATRIDGLHQTQNSVLESLSLHYRFEHAIDEHYLPDLAATIATQESYRNMATVNRFLNVAELARDFIGSVSSRGRNIETFLAGTRSIVAGTCVGLGRASLGLTSTPFDLVIIDEAARCTPGELSVPLQSARWVVLVGDHLQLEPTHPPEVVRKVARELQIGLADVKRSDFERVFNSAYGRLGGASLTQQYRMLPAIGEIVSNVFYQPHLNQGLAHARPDPIMTLDQPPTGLRKPITWIATDAFGDAAFQRDVSKGRNVLINQTEAELIVLLLKKWDADRGLKQWLSAHPGHTKVIGIICTYREQCKLINGLIKRAGLSEELAMTIKLDTVDSYQGKENLIVVLSLTRNNEDGSTEHGAATIKEGFMAQPNRLNVAMSRAMDRLVIVGARLRWPEAGPMAAVAQHFLLQVDAGHAEILEGASLKTSAPGAGDDVPGLGEVTKTVAVVGEVE